MPSPARELFARPMPYEVIWNRDGKRLSVRTLSYSSALATFEHERKEGRYPGLYLGGMVLADCAEEVEVR